MRRTAVAQGLCWTAAAALIVAYVAMFRRYAVDFPQADDFSQILAVPYYFSLQPTPRDALRFLASLSVEHRIGTLRVAALVQARLFGGLDFPALMATGAGLLACATALVVLEAPRGHRAWVAVAATALLVSPVNYEAQLWATGALQHFGVLAFALAALWCFARSSPWVRAAGAALALAAAFTSANGLAALPAAAVVLWRSGRRTESVVAAVAGAALGLAYFDGFDADAATSTGAPLVLARFFVLAAGSLAVHPTPAALLGLVLAATWAWLVTRHRRVPPVIVGWICFLAASLAAMAVGRGALGDAAALLSRYRVYSAMSALVTLVAVLHVLPARSRVVAGAIAVPLALAAFAAGWWTMMPVVARASLGQEIARAAYLATGHGIYVPWPPQDYGDFILDRAAALGYYKPESSRCPDFATLRGDALEPFRACR